MREFFRGWKRKAGCVTLAMACAFITECVRTFDVHDKISYCPASNIKYALAARGEVIDWTRSESVDGASINQPGFSWRRIPKWTKSQLTPTEIKISESRLLDWDRRLCGFAFYSGQIKVPFTNGPVITVRMIGCSVPFWSIVVPLTALSAYMLLNKPREKNKQPVPHA